jgi:hypothetical protein
MKESDKKLLEKNGWTVECESPYEIRHTDGSFATAQAAWMVLDQLLEEVKKKERKDEEKAHREFIELLCKLYYRYKKTDDEEIRKYLKTIKLVTKENKGIGTIYGYYPLSKEAIDKIKKAPRNNSLTFDATETQSKPIKKLVELKKVTFLVKSTSRFFLKPDVGEIFDQIHWEDLITTPPAFDAICLESGYETLPNTDGEHHLMTATLLKLKK